MTKKNTAVNAQEVQTNQGGNVTVEAKFLGYNGYDSVVKEVAQLPAKVRFGLAVDGEEKEIVFGHFKHGGRQTYVIKNGAAVPYKAEQLFSFLQAKNVTNVDAVKQYVSKLVSLHSMEDKKTGLKHDMVKCSVDGCDKLVNAANMDYVQRNAKFWTGISEFTPLCIDHTPKKKATNGVAANQGKKDVVAKAHNVDRAKCEACGAEVSTVVAKFANEKFGKVLCYKGGKGCQSKQPVEKSINQHNVNVPPVPVNNEPAERSEAAPQEQGKFLSAKEISDVKQHIANLKQQVAVAPKKARKDLRDDAGLKVAIGLLQGLHGAMGKKATKQQMADYVQATVVDILEKLQELDLVGDSEFTGLSYPLSRAPRKPKSKKEEVVPSATEVATEPASEASGDVPQVEEAPDSAPTPEQETKEAPASNEAGEESVTEVAQDDSAELAVSTPEVAESSNDAEAGSTDSLCKTEGCDADTVRGQDLCPTCVRDSIINGLE